jgi:predicted nucleic acid-binding protein
VARFLDSSVLVRYLTDDDPPRARVAEAIVESGDLLVSAVVLAEVAYTLRSTYRYPRSTIVDALLAFVQRENVEVLDAEKAHVAIALDKARSGGLSFGDALILTQMRSAGVRELYSFDKDFRDPAIVVHDRPAQKEAP